MLESLITSKTRINLLLKFFLNPDSSDYLRNLEVEFGESTNAIRIELNRFEKAGLLKSQKIKNRKYFSANKKHPLYSDINNILLKYTGLNEIIQNVSTKLGNLNRVYVIGDIALGKNTDNIQLIFIAKRIDNEYLQKIIDKTSKTLKRKISYEVFENDTIIKEKSEKLLIWENNNL